jgi:hypothetical protein
VPYASTGETWDANKCVPIQGDKPAGEPCVYGGTLEATDDCNESTYCWGVQDVEGVPTGVCTSFCEGSADDPSCAAGAVCLLANEGSINLCIPQCDPLLQDCGDGFGCAWLGEEFGCLVTVDGQAVGEPCGYANDCVPGTVCLDADASASCVGAACCVDYCAVDSPESCPDPELECVGLFVDGRAPVGLETLGACVVPGVCGGEDLGCLEHATIVTVDD